MPILNSSEFSLRELSNIGIAFNAFISFVFIFVTLKTLPNPPIPASASNLSIANK
jgi:hypothetical protein